jgi:hypothetical protein
MFSFAQFLFRSVTVRLREHDGECVARFTDVITFGMNVMPVEAILCSLKLFRVLGSGPTYLWHGSDISMWGSVSLRQLFLQNVIKQHGSRSKNLFCFRSPS